MAVSTVSALTMMAMASAGFDARPLRVALGLALVLVVPGYALSQALFPGSTLGMAERAAFSLGTSLATTALGGLVLHWSSWGLHAGSWSALLGSVAVLASGLALVRGIPPDSRRAVGSAFVPVRLRLTLAQWPLLLLAGLIVAVAARVAGRGETSQEAPGFTQLWMLPGGGGNGTIQLGVQSHEPATATYRLEVVADGRSLIEKPSITLEPGARWTGSIAPAGAAASTVTARLYRQHLRPEECPSAVPGKNCRHSTEVYRQVVLRRGSPR